MHNVPIFPEFRSIHFQDRDWYNAYYNKFDPYADFSFGNFMIWLNQHDDLMVSSLNDNIVIRCTTLFMNNKQMLTFLGTNKIAETIQTLLDYQSSVGEPVELLGIPEVVIEHLSNKTYLFSIEDDRDDYEYILSTKKLSRLEGPEYSRIRREMSIVDRSWGHNAEFKELDLRDHHNTHYLYTQLHKWDRAFSTNDSAHQEAGVIATTLRLAPRLNYQNLSLFVDGELTGFLLYQPLPHKDCIIVNHIKASYEHRFTFDYMFIELAKRLTNQGIDYINFEQDLGIPGLREHKESLRPVRYLKKFTIRPRSQA